MCGIIKNNNVLKGLSGEMQQGYTDELYDRFALFFNFKETPS